MAFVCPQGKVPLLLPSRPPAWLWRLLCHSSAIASQSRTGCRALVGRRAAPCSRSGPWSASWPLSWRRLTPFGLGALLWRVGVDQKAKAEAVAGTPPDVCHWFLGRASRWTLGREGRPETRGPPPTRRAQNEQRGGPLPGTETEQGHVTVAAVSGDGTESSRRSGRRWMSSSR